MSRESEGFTATVLKVRYSRGREHLAQAA